MRRFITVTLGRTHDIDGLTAALTTLKAAESG